MHHHKLFDLPHYAGIAHNLNYQMDITDQQPASALESVSRQQGDDDHHNEHEEGELDKKSPPTFATLYHSMGRNKFCTPSVEKKLRSTWARWAEYCKCRQQFHW